MVLAEEQKMSNQWGRIWKEERAQDLVEYTILVAAIALVAVGLLLSVGDGVSGIWKSGGNQLAAANTVLSGPPAPAPGGGDGNGGGNHGGGHGHHGD